MTFLNFLLRFKPVRGHLLRLDAAHKDYLWAGGTEDIGTFQGLLEANGYVIGKYLDRLCIANVALEATHTWYLEGKSLHRC